jgi:hypothetical protein
MGGGGASDRGLPKESRWRRRLHPTPLHRRATVASPDRRPHVQVVVHWTRLGGGA